MTQMLICRLTHCPGRETATVVLEDIDRQLELAVLIPMNGTYRLALVLAHCPYASVLELINGLLVHSKTRALRVVLDEDEAGVSATVYIGETHDETAVLYHPADTLALAVRTRAPIFATDEILHHAHPLGQARSRCT